MYLSTGGKEEVVAATEHPVLRFVGANEEYFFQIGKPRGRSSITSRFSFIAAPRTEKKANSLSSSRQPRTRLRVRRVVIGSPPPPLASAFPLTARAANGAFSATMLPPPSLHPSIHPPSTDEDRFFRARTRLKHILPPSAAQTDPGTANESQARTN